jgi:hypothetical protein
MGFLQDFIHTIVHELVKRLSAGKSLTATYVFLRKPPFPRLTGKGKQTQKLASAGSCILSLGLALKKGGTAKKEILRFNFSHEELNSSRKSGRKTYSVPMQRYGISNP